MDEKTDNTSVEVTGRYAIVYGNLTTSYVDSMVSMLNTYAEMGFRIIGVTPFGSCAIVYTMENISGDKGESK